MLSASQYVSPCEPRKTSLAIPSSFIRMKGYDNLALLGSRYPELSILRKFGKLSIKCLLYQQAELSWLEGDIAFQEEKCSGSSDEKCLTSWHHLTSGDVDSDGMEYRRKVAELQQKLRDYRMFSRCCKRRLICTKALEQMRSCSRQLRSSSCYQPRKPT